MSPSPGDIWQHPKTLVFTTGETGVWLAPAGQTPGMLLATTNAHALPQQHYSSSAGPRNCVLE